jgi:hypothetical protein
VKKALEDSVNKAKKAYEDLEKFQTEKGVDIDDNLGSAETKGFKDKLSFVMQTAGDEAGKAINTTL